MNNDFNLNYSQNLYRIKNYFISNSVLTLLSKMTATSWPLAIFYRLSFIARRGKQSCFSPAEFNRWGKSHNSTKCKWSLTHKVQCLLSTADAVPPISFLKFPLLFHKTVPFPPRFMLVIMQFTLINNWIILSHVSKSYFQNWSIQEDFSDSKDKNCSLYHCQVIQEKSSFCVYLAALTYIEIIFS